MLMGEGSRRLELPNPIIQTQPGSWPWWRFLDASSYPGLPKLKSGEEEGLTIPPMPEIQLLLASALPSIPHLPLADAD